MSRFERVVLPEGRELGRKASMTFLKHYQACNRSGFLYQLYKGSAQTAPMIRGSALHLVFERSLQAMIMQSEPMVPADIVKSIVNDVLAEYPVPFVEHDFIRESAYRWAGEFTIDPGQVIATETLVVLELGGWEVRCKIDFAEAQAGGLVVNVKDWKSSRAAPAYEEIARRRPDGSLAGKSFQLVLYALALAFGRPVRETFAACEACDGNGFNGGDPGESQPCTNCLGSGRVREEILEPFPLAAQAERFDLELVFPAIEDREGRMVRRPVTLSRLELGEYRESLIGLLDQLDESQRTGDWPAVLSDEACGECPAKLMCPIPLELHDHAGVINTVEEAAEASEVLERRTDELAALRKELKLFAKGREEPQIRYGANKAWRFVYGESDRIDDKDAMFDAVARAVEYGEPFDRTRFVRTAGSTNFKAVKLTDEELAEEAAR